MDTTTGMFSLNGKSAVVMGGAGGLGEAISRGLAGCGARVAVVDLNASLAEKLASQLDGAKGYGADAADEDSLKRCSERIISDFDSADVLVNAVGGNIKEATTSDDTGFFDISAAALQRVVDFNLFAGAVLPSQVFGRVMAKNPDGGSIINISSVVGIRPFTRVGGYCAAKAAVINFTQWLAVNMARSGYPNVRVNAVAPGVVLTEQNRFLLTDEKTGEFTARGKSVVDHTPVGRLGQPSDLVGTVVWLASEASRFVTGIVVPVDGGFSACSGV